VNMTSVLKAFPQSGNPWQLQTRRASHCVLRDMAITSGSVAEIALTLSDTTKERLRHVNIRSIDPLELSQLTLMLHHEGYLAHEACSELGHYQVDYTGLIDPLRQAWSGLESIRGVDDVKYALAIRHYETAIDAVLGIERLTGYLNGRVVDVYA